MAIMEEVSERGLGLPLGVGLLIAAVSAGPKLMKAGRPLIKNAIKGYLAVQEKSKEMFAETTERMQDIYAEAKHEYDEGMHVVEAEAHIEASVVEEKPTEGAKRTTRSRKIAPESEEK